jgi:hypothetical protein
VNGPVAAPVRVEDGCDPNHSWKRRAAATNERKLAKEQLQRRTLGFAQEVQVTALTRAQMHGL